jgi:uncharacterized protein
MDIKQKKYLLQLARESILNPNKNDDLPISESLKEKKGVFVTLTKKGELRGCIGHIIPILPCYKAIIECAQSAAYNDPRFNPVTSNEIKDLHIEISILSTPKKLIYSDADDLLKKLSPNKDGVILKKGIYQSTFLPQVWEQLSDKKEFLSQLCLKAGLNPNEWKKANLEIKIYNVEKFHE